MKAREHRARLGEIREQRVRYRAKHAALRSEGGRFLGSGYDELRRELAKLRAVVQGSAWWIVNDLELLVERVS